MKKSLVIIALLTLFLLFLGSCKTAQQTAQPGGFESRIRQGELYIMYPKSRVDGLIRRVGILGDGEGKDEIAAEITKVFMDCPTGIDVIERGNLDSLLGGKIIEYGTGLSSADSQTLSQLLQVDHVLLFSEQSSPHQDYIYGGVHYVRLRLKIVNTRSGKIIYQTQNQWGTFYPDPRPTYSGISPKPNNVPRAMVAGMVLFELRYALGQAALGIQVDKSKPGLTVGLLLRDSPAERAGIKTGDRISSVNGSSIHSASDFMMISRNVKQGDTQKVQLERDGKIMEVNVQYPVIPKIVVEEEPKEDVGKKYLKTI